MRVLFVASNPSVKSPDQSPLHPSTKSRSILDSWISGLDIEPAFINVSDVKTEKNKRLSASQIKQSLPSLVNKIQQYDADYIVALGDTATLALSLINQTHVAIPHPSGLNRKLNDKQEILKIKNTLYKISVGII